MKTQFSQRSSEKLSDDLKYTLFGTSFPYLIIYLVFRVEAEDQKQEQQLQGILCMVLTQSSSPVWTGSVSGFGNATS